MVEHLFVFKVVGCVSTCVCVSVCVVCVSPQKWLDHFDQLSFMEAFNPGITYNQQAKYKKNNIWGACEEVVNFTMCCPPATAEN